MHTTSNGRHFYPGQPAEQPDRSSPTRRVAAYYSDIELVGRSQAFIEVMKQVDSVANINLPVLLIGETETLKELVASAIHQHSDRHDQPFIAVNCGAIPAQWLESELFGDADRRGLYEEADGGTILLDEIAQTTSSFQFELLHALQTGEIRRLGSNESRKVNVRVIAAGERNIEQRVAAGRFDRDLFQHLSAFSIMLPQCVNDYSVQQPESTNGSVEDDWVTLSVIEGRYVARVLEHTGGNKQAAARVLAVDRKTLDRMIKRHHIDCQHVRRARAKASGTG
ncbi:MAG TPA: sigma-54-dependent Fis family transcriptional regulator, partial [Pyrinomonadaceae bacterium]